MKIGVNLHNYGPFASKRAIDAIAERSEALGYDSIWTADHILVPRTEPEPFGQLLETLTTLSYIAAKTRRIALGTSVLVLPQREPILVAKQAATIDELSGGRLTLGIGVGWIEREFDYLGADFAARGDRADEYIAHSGSSGPQTSHSSPATPCSSTRPSSHPDHEGKAASRSSSAAPAHEPYAAPPAWRTDGTPSTLARRRSVTPQSRSPRSRQTERSRSLCGSRQPSVAQPDPQAPQKTPTTEHSRGNRT
jgi:alkanesulfonate monooxygenase SsuD/methylene tetrahydromethanopterin reductase-like flavin-dependent oxidoreductase (luciferase family)